MVIKFNIPLFAGIFYRFVSIALGTIYGSVVAFFSAVFMIWHLICKLKIKFPLNAVSLLFSPVAGIVGGIDGFLIGFLYRYLDRFSWSKKRILRLIVSIFCSNIVGDFIMFSGVFFIVRILPDVTTKMALFFALSSTLIRKLFMVLINSPILLIMLKVYDNIVDRKK